MMWKAPQMWQGSSCFIIGGGPSVFQIFGIPDDLKGAMFTQKAHPSVCAEYMKPIQNKNVIGVNNAYLFGSWIAVLFFGDCSWYLIHQERVSKWPGLKITCCPRFMNRHKGNMEGLKFLRKDPDHRQGITTNRSAVAWNNNSGAAAISLASHFGASKIFLLGFDMVLGEGGKSHWHGSHQPGGAVKRSPPFSRHLKGFPAIAEDAKKLGITIYNISPMSHIKEFKKVDLEWALKNS